MGAHTTIDAETIERELSKLDDLPLSVHAYRAEVGEDWTGDPAVWVWVVLDEDDTPFDLRQVVRERVRDFVTHLEGYAADWVFVRFGAASEEQSG